MSEYFLQMSEALGIHIGFILFLVAWSLVWKALALWKSARKGHHAWFVIFIVLNTIGLLEILYLFVFSKMKFFEREKKHHHRKPEKKSRTNKRKRR